MNKNILVWLGLGLLIAFTLWKLQSNKHDIDQEAQLSMVGPSFVPVQIIKAKNNGISNSLESSGIFMPNKEMWVISETAGRILEVYKDRGDYVRTGDLLAKVDDEFLRIELETVQLTIDKLQKDRTRLNNLIEGEAIPKSKIEEIDLGIATAQARIKGISRKIEDTSIKSPTSGIMTYRVVEKGGVIGPGIQVAQITDISALKLMIRVTEQDVLQIKKGQKVQVFPDVYGNTNLNGLVTNVGIKADNVFTYDVEILVPNPKSSPLKAGMHAKAVFDFKSKASKGLTIPRNALVGSVQEPYVFVLQADDTVSKRNIVVGARSSEDVEVLQGITADESVVLSGQINLNDGSKVKVVE